MNYDCRNEKVKPLVRFALIGDCHHSNIENYGTRDCLGAQKQLGRIIDILNKEQLDFIFSLGDLGDGREEVETFEMLDEYARSIYPVKFTIGNHDLCQRSAAVHAEICGLPAPFYDFACGGYRFIVLNSFEQSRYCAPDSDERKNYDKFRSEHTYMQLQDWPGFMTENSFEHLRFLLDTAECAREQVIVLAHVPVYYGYYNCAKTPDAARLLKLFDNYSNIRAYFAGHYHSGNTAVRNGVFHKTVKAVCDYAEPTACIVEADDFSIRLVGIGEEQNFVHRFSIEQTFIEGTAPKGSYIMVNSGEITRVESDGHFKLKVPCPGMYCIKAVADGFSDEYLPYIEAPAYGINISLKADANRKLIHGLTDGYSSMRITIGNKPVRWFDVAGNSYGAVEPKEEMWHDHCDIYPTVGQYAFTINCSDEALLRIEFLPKHKDIKNDGWYKGDLHAHLVHGENLYIGNPIQSAFIGRAEGYDWLYMAADYSNDGYAYDTKSIALKLSSSDFLYRMNAEFPKSRSNHFGNIGVEPEFWRVDFTKISSLEIAEKFIWSNGGITIPVHPFEGHMSFREMCLWLCIAPERMPCIDFFYHDDYDKKFAEQYWFMLLNRGYEIGCFATSDAAFDIGRTPGTNRGCTYVKMSELSEDALIDAIKHRRTIVSWDSCILRLEIDDAVSGDILPADGCARKLCLRIVWRKGATGILRIIRNGQDIAYEKLYFPSDDTEMCFERSVTENQDCWYTAIVESESNRIRSVSSPIFFRTAAFVLPETIPMPKYIPDEMLAEFERLTPVELADPKLIDRTREKLRFLGG